jgi:hypothetical protein
MSMSFAVRIELAMMDVRPHIALFTYILDPIKKVRFLHSLRFSGRLDSQIGSLGLF